PPPSPRGRYRGPPSRLSERDLIEIASTTTLAHLLAISTRPQIGAVVTDVLLRHGHKDVFRALAENPGAQFSTRGCEALVRHAESDAPLTEKSGLRLDVPLAFGQLRGRRLRRARAAGSDLTFLPQPLTARADLQGALSRRRWPQRATLCF